MTVAPGPLGWITPELRTKAQHDAHESALAAMPRFALAPPVTGGPVKLVLTDLWKDPDCVADMGQAFTGFHQLTGSCVGASEGNAICTLSCVQRKLTDGATRAMIPWWLYPYGRTRYNEGDRGRGEGAVDSVMGATLASEGVFDIRQPGLPQFNDDDGLYLTEALEMIWSDGAAIPASWIQLGKQFPLGSHAPLYDVAGIKAAILNGYPVLDGCNYYVGKGVVKGTGTNAYVTGRYDGAGGHSTCFLGYWDHPTDGPLYLYSNQWPTQVYPKDPAGGGRCCVWLPESEVAKLFRNGGGAGETMALSHLNYFPAQPKVLDWYA